MPAQARYRERVTNHGDATGCPAQDALGIDVVAHVQVAVLTLSVHTAPLFVATVGFTKCAFRHQYARQRSGGEESEVELWLQNLTGLARTAKSVRGVCV